MAKNYLNNRLLYECIVEHRRKVSLALAEGRTPPPMPDYAGRCILKICNRLGTRFNFSGYSFRADMIGDAILDCVNGFDNFDSDRFNNPFGYFSMIAWRAMVRKIFNEKKETYLKHKSFQNALLAGGNYDSPADYQDSHATRVSTGSSAVDGPGSVNTVSDGIVNDFEELLARRKNRKKERTDEKD